MDITGVFWDVVMQKGTTQNYTQEKMAKLRAMQILRSHASKSGFIIAASDVNKNIETLQAYIASHAGTYSQPEKLNDQERERIDEQVGLLVRQSTDHIQKLEDSIKAETDLSNQAKAHMHGVALILAERLQSSSGEFDRRRSKRYSQLNQKRGLQVKRMRELQNISTSSPPQPSRSNTWSEGEDSQLLEQDQLEYNEAQTIQNELHSLDRQVRETERSMIEIAQLTDIFSKQVFQQSEVIEQLYNQAVQTTEAISGGNVQLQKAIRLNSSTRKIIFAFFAIASFIVLFFDWWSS